MNKLWKIDETACCAAFQNPRVFPGGWFFAGEERVNFWGYGGGHKKYMLTSVIAIAR